tara:strand:+ start:1926 stop:2792 length:867 start_codon:yes stop_codon:yes gene_type:complete
MTIRQQGGVFGRNPTFNDVDAASITTDNLTSSSVSFTGNSTFDDNAKLIFGDAGNLEIYTNGTTSYIREAGGGDLQINASDDVFIRGTDTNNYMARFRETSSVDLYHNNIRKFQTVASGISVTGNVVVASGNGIDFSATSGTGTSELFSDYEEGVWSPAFSGGDYSFTYNKQKGSYTKIGNRVYVDCVLYIHPSTAPSGSTNGNVSITGLPYAFNKQNDVEFVGGIIHFKQLFMTTAEAIGYRLTDGGTSLLMYDTLATTYPELNYVQASDVNANSRIRLQFSYPTNG